MESVVTSIVALIVTLGILIAFHEFGHFWVARKLGVKVLRFSVGFGKPLWKCTRGPDKTEYVLAAIPLGGYVKMLDEREGDVAEEELHRAFNRQPVSKRIAIVVAGPLFNFIFAIFAYFIMYSFGVPGIKPIVGEVTEGSIAAAAGIEQMDQVFAINGRKTPTWNSVRLTLLEQSIDESSVEMEFVDTSFRHRIVELDISEFSTEMKQKDLLGKLGIHVYSPPIPAVISKLDSGGAALRDGLKVDDRIVAVNGKPLQDWAEWVQVVRANPQKTIEVKIERGAATEIIRLTPDLVESETGSFGRIGARPYLPESLFEGMETEESYPIGTAMIVAIVKTWQMSALTLKMIGKMLIGEVSVKNLSGPITIATYAGYTASAGPTVFLSFLAIVSISLGVLNLLPIPLLDGGHLLYYFIEIVKGSELSEMTQARMQQVGIILLATLMALAFYNDIERLITG